MSRTQISGTLRGRYCETMIIRITAMFSRDDDTLIVDSVERVTLYANANNGQVSQIEFNPENGFTDDHNYWLKIAFRLLFNDPVASDWLWRQVQSAEQELGSRSYRKAVAQGVS